MSEKDRPRQLRGLARSIDALFPEEHREPPTAEQAEHGPAVVPDESGSMPAVVPDEVGSMPAVEASEPSETPGAEELSLAVESFLAAHGAGRDEAAEGVRQHAAALREANAARPVARAVERLALGAGDPPDEAAIALAGSLLTDRVSAFLVADLGSSREEERRSVLIGVCRLLGSKVAPAVADALAETTDRFARRALMECMVALGPDGMPLVEDMVEDARWFVVRNALAILGDVGGERPVELIVGTLAHEDARVRREAVLALAKVGGDDAGILVVGMLEDPDAEVKTAAAVAAGALKVERALKPLLRILEAEADPDVSIGVLRALGQIGDPGAVLAIEKRAVGSFFSKPPSAVRIAAYRALNGIGTPHAKELLEAAAEDKDPAVKAAVRSLLGMD